MQRVVRQLATAFETYAQAKSKGEDIYEEAVFRKSMPPSEAIRQFNQHFTLLERGGLSRKLGNISSQIQKPISKQNTACSYLVNTRGVFVDSIN